MNKCPYIIRGMASLEGDKLVIFCISERWPDKGGQLYNIL